MNLRQRSSSPPPPSTPTCTRSWPGRWPVVRWGKPFSQIILYIYPQGVSFRSCKLLTKAYYNLLREPVVTSPTSPTSPTHSHQPASRGKSKDDPKLNWQTLLQTEGPQVTRKRKPIVILRRPKSFETNHTKWKTLEMTKIVGKTTEF